MNQPDLLGQLRIEREARHDAAPPRGGVPWWAVLLIIALGGGAWWLFGRTAPAVLVSTAKAQEAARAPVASSVLDASGYVVARRQATVSSKITGKVVSVLIEEGMRVEEGQVLATLDDTQARSQLALSAAQLASARSQQAEIEAGLRQARADLTRQQELHQRRLGTAAQLDAAQAAADTLAARLISQRRQIEVAEQALALSQVAVDDTVVRAPFAGVVIAKAAQPGEMISPVSAGGGFTRTGIGTIVDMDSLEVEVDVNEAFIGRVQQDMAIEATLNAYPDWKIPGNVIAVIPTADRSKATVRVRVSLASDDARIVPEMGVRVRFLEPRDDSAPAPTQLSGVLVPTSALLEANGQTRVFVIENGRAALREVQAAATLGGFRNVTAGLSAGQTVVIDPPPELIDGSPVSTAQ
ncbi:efflux RND transporter periplasmic adaptor subunit [Pseudomarimonas arenosa]|uniref:Efflux RND transporter periplasmic adaptor subunit n=1 Tax=Pseudomarimonas arenosa TaxID=2774145 RepID=A0AAW3ZPK9_9GAMM|nr:efflux RND transporter periplasmic adaptor subunit [Pseudomarimonas arenosa]MBD8528105.1 efflux RND transporter periplasmic adaptor subunit [Pseudomarimonas arenosa]